MHTLLDTAIAFERDHLRTDRPVTPRAGWRSLLGRRPHTA